MDNKMDQQEVISALMDGQLRGKAFAQAVEAVAGDPVARQAWHTYHLIGDVLRSGQPAAATAPDLFMARLTQRLALEQPCAPENVAVTQAPEALDAVRSERAAANDATFRWKLVAGFASLAAVAAVGWTLVAGSARTEPPQLAAAPAQQPAGTVLANGERGVMIRDARLDELLAAHRQFGGASALQMPAGFLRNATFEGPGR